MRRKYLEPLLTREQYFFRWDKEELNQLKERHMILIYEEYKTKHIVFNRDNFECQVVDCKFKDSPFTLHHFKHASNGGKTTPRNCVTVCKAHQKMYHSGRISLKFKEREELPNHIKGSTQAHEWYVNGKPKKENKLTIVSKETLRENKLIRKSYREIWGRPLTFAQICCLMAFLFSFEVGL